jgi:site-specific DNA-methyltransferase (adenine-specific)
MVSIIMGDCLTVMPTLPRNSVDLVLTDPAYWTLNKWRNVGTTTRLGGNHDKNAQTGWFTTIDEQGLYRLMRQTFDVLKANRHAVIMCDGQTLRYVLGYAETAGFSYYKPLIWDKMAIGMGYHFRNQHEFMVLLDKGDNRHPHDLGMPDIFHVRYVRGEFPTEKPVELMRVMIAQLTEKNEIVLDPFMGSGTTGVACILEHRDFIGIEIDEKYVQIARKRIADMVGPLFVRDANADET